MRAAGTGELSAWRLAVVAWVGFLALSYGLTALLARNRLGNPIPPAAAHVLLLFVFSAFGLWSRRHAMPLFDVREWRQDLKGGAMLGCGTGALGLSLGYLASRLHPFPPEALNPLGLSLTSASASPAELASVVALMLVLGPLSEELFYRGLLQNTAGRESGPSLVFTAVAFWLGHANAFWTPSALILGVVLGNIMRVKGRLSAPLFCHIANNACVVAFGLWHRSS